MNKEQIKTLKAQVGHILKQSPHTRNSDKELVGLVCRIFGYNPIEKASSIERCRRWYNQKKMYLPTSEEVAKQRRLNIDEWKQVLGLPNAWGPGDRQGFKG